MRSRSFTAGLVTVLAALLVAPPAEAQIATPPPVHAPIRSARRAANAASAHVRAEQRPTMPSTENGKPAATHTSVVADADAPARGDSAEITIIREHFTYPDNGRRDPFVSLIASGELRPMITDLRLAAVIYDPAGHSVAVLRDLTTQEQYRVRVGSTLGRMRVARIHPKSVTFTIEEFGYSRQAVLALDDDSTKQ